MKTGKPIWKISPDPVDSEYIGACVDITDDGRVAVVGNDGLISDKPRYNISVWDIKTNQRLTVLSGHQGIIQDVEFSKDGLRLASCSSDETARIWDAHTGAQLSVMKVKEKFVRSISNLAFVNNDKQLVTSHIGGVFLWDVESEQIVKDLIYDQVHLYLNLSVSPDGKHVASAPMTGHSTSVWDVTTGKVVSGFSWRKNFFNCVRVLFTCDSKYFITTGAETENDPPIKPRISVWEKSGNAELVAELCGPSEIVWASATSRDGKLLACSGETDETIYIWNLEKILKEIDEDRSSPCCK